MYELARRPLGAVSRGTTRAWGRIGAAACDPRSAACVGGGTVIEIARVLRPNGQFLFCEHVRSDDSAAARWQDRLAGPWSVFGQGCRGNRSTLSSIERTFGGVQVDRGEWQGASVLVRPLMIGRAGQGETEVGRAERSTESYDRRPEVVESGGTK
ncbi:hypothetical protein GCM10027068_26870 [Prescottella soli]